MYSVDEILALLQKGESADSLAAAFSDTLNKATKQLAAKNAEAERQAREKKLNDLAAGVISAMVDYLTYANPEVGKWITDEETPLSSVAELRRVLDSTLEVAALGLKLIDRQPSVSTDSDAAIQAFLSSVGL